MKEKVKIVTTVNGKKFLSSDVRFISGKYYKIGDSNIENSGDCYEIDGKFYRGDTDYIRYDMRDKIYKVYNQDIFTRGIVGYDVKSGFIYGYFTHDGTDSLVKIKIDGEYNYVMDEKILNGTSYLEDLSTGIFHHRQSIDSRKFIIPSKCRIDYKNSLPYDSTGLLKDKSKIFKKEFDDCEISRNVKNYSPGLGQLSLGLEFETSLGIIPNRICRKLGLIPLRDGSIQGIEYVTIPHSGKNGLQAIIETVKELDKRTEYDENCSLHLHIGSIPRTEEFILAFFKLTCFLQDEIFALFPLYKKYNYGYKRKHYTKPFPINDTLLLMDNKITNDNIKENFNILFEYMSMGIPYSNYNNSLDNVHSHPSDPDGNRKWQIRSRYVAINLIPLIFGNKQTIEFRIHTPTYDLNKIINYIFLCSSLVNYTISNTKSILENSKFLRNINLNKLIYNSNMNSQLVDAITNYINHRTNYVYNKNRDSNIHFKESDYVPSKSYINWNQESDIKCNSKSDFEILMKEYADINIRVVENNEGDHWN